jgi:putative endopeptidase
MADDALNYGAIGVVIGHEITHAFDDQGRKFNPDGNLEDWWTEDDAVRFEALAKKLVDQYDNYQVDSNAHVNGQLTLGENIADLGGVEVSYTAFRMTKPGDNKLIEKMTPDQRFFAGFARIWRMNIRPEEALRLIKIDPHSPCIFRVDGTLSNVPEFMRAFNVRNGNALFKPEGELVKIW